MNKISVAILGFGGRGMSMAKAIASYPDDIYVKAVAEPEKNRQQMAKDEFGVDNEYIFDNYNDFLEKGVIADLLIITTMDKQHYEPLMKALKLGYKNILMEKPISPSLSECVEMANAAKEYNANVIVLHTLRYNLYFRKLREIVRAGKLGEVMGIRHIEGAGLMLYSHAFVRGNWGNTADAAPFIMQKCCHDTDIMTYIIGKKYKKLSSFGELKYFTEKSAPEGSAERCIDCKYKDECRFSMFKLYTGEYHKPFYDSAVTKYGFESLEEAARKGEYGRCVYKCNNDVMENQVLCFEFEDGSMGTFTATGFDLGGRRTEIRGTEGRLVGNEGTGQITVYRNIVGSVEEDIREEYDIFSESSATLDHRGCDIQLTYDLIDFFKNGNRENLSFIEGALESHLACFAAEISRKEERVVYIDELRK